MTPKTLNILASGTRPLIQTGTICKQLSSHFGAFNSKVVQIASTFPEVLGQVSRCAGYGHIDSSQSPHVKQPVIGLIQDVIRLESGRKLAKVLKNHCDDSSERCIGSQDSKYLLFAALGKPLLKSELKVHTGKA